MWIMTPFGILMPSTRPDHAIKRGDSRKLQIRVRDRRALTYLRDNYMGDELSKIVATPKMDYNFRAYCTHDDFARAVAQMIVDIDYEKFKPESVSHDLHKLYNEIWYVVFDHYEFPDKRRKGAKR